MLFGIVLWLLVLIGFHDRLLIVERSLIVLRPAEGSFHQNWGSAAMPLFEVRAAAMLPNRPWKMALFSGAERPVMAEGLNRSRGRE